MPEFLDQLSHFAPRADVRNDILVLIGRTGSTLLIVLGAITALGTEGLPLR